MSCDQDRYNCLLSDLLEKVNIEDPATESVTADTRTASDKTDSAHYDFSLDTSDDESFTEGLQLDSVNTGEKEKGDEDDEWIDIDEPPELAYIPCANHNLQLCINDAFKSVKGLLLFLFPLC